MKDGKACFRFERRDFIMRLYPLLLCAAIAAGLLLIFRFSAPRFQLDGGAAEGRLYLNAEELEKKTVLFLRGGWEFYQGRLLEPADFSASPPAPARYLEMGKNAPLFQGPATYRLTIHLDAVSRDYLLQFSAANAGCRLWINGVPYIKADHADPAAPGRRALLSAAFSASTSAELIIAVPPGAAVSEPPLFGTIDAVCSVSQLRLLWSAILCTAAVLIGLLCLAAGTRQKKPGNETAFFLYCLFFISYNLGPVLRILGNPDGWTDLLQEAGFRGMLLILCVSAGKICSINRLCHNIIVMIESVLGVLAVLFPLVPVCLTGQARAAAAYGGMQSGGCWMAAVYLFAAGMRSLFCTAREGIALPAGFVFFGCALMIDGAFFRFAPAGANRFLQIAGAAFALIIYGKLCSENLMNNRESSSLKNILNLERTYSRSLQDYIESTAKRNHDVKKQFMLLRYYSDRGEKDKLDALLSSLCEAQTAGQPAYYSCHPLINTLLSSQFSRAIEAGIQVEHDIVGIPSVLLVDDQDLCCLLMNLLDNAIEACLRLPNRTKKWLRIQIQVKGGYFSVVCRNASDGRKAANTAASEENRFAHGYGLRIIGDIVAKYQGLQEIREEEGVFHIHCALCIPNMREDAASGRPDAQNAELI